MSRDAHVTYLLAASQVASFLGQESRNIGEGELKRSQREKKLRNGLSFGLTHATMGLSFLNQSAPDTINLSFVLQVQHISVFKYVGRRRCTAASVVLLCSCCARTCAWAFVHVPGSVHALCLSVCARES